MVDRTLRVTSTWLGCAKRRCGYSRANSRVSYTPQLILHCSATLPFDPTGISGRLAGARLIGRRCISCCCSSRF